MDKIIDIHSHILPGVDDGPMTIEESVEILSALEEKGFDSIILTSHYIENTDYNSNEKVRMKILNELQEKTNINLYLGNEVFITENVIDLYRNRELITLNKSSYMLVEFPLNGYNINTTKIICELTSHNIIPIIAHPERYLYIQDNYATIDEILDYGCYLQCNIGSLTGKYGKRAQKLVKYLLKKGVVTFIGSDIHSLRSIPTLEKSYNKLKKIVGEEKFKELTYYNPMRVLKNEKLS